MLTGTCHADVTEGGVSEQSPKWHCFRYRVIVDDKKVPRHQVTDAVVNYFKIDPRFGVGAGATIIAVDPAQADVLLNDYSYRYAAVVAGLFTAKNNFSGCVMIVE